MYDSFTLEQDITFGQETFEGTAKKLGVSVAQGLLNYYVAVQHCATIVELPRIQNRFISSRRAGQTLKGMINALDDELSGMDILPATAEKAPVSFLMPNYFSLEEALELLGRMFTPPTLNEGQSERVTVASLRMETPGNFLIGLYEGNPAEPLTFICKSQITDFTQIE